MFIQCILLTTEIAEAQRRLGKVGLIINFNKPTLIDGVKRFVLLISVSQCPLWLNPQNYTKNLKF
jgi:hypothetical protein